ncbi:MAG TPA: hypothetical protein VF708_03580 [Pyrinomonadaceae bacterium]|jgi:hypothetical protein
MQPDAGLQPTPASNTRRGKHRAMLMKDKRRALGSKDLCGCALGD